MWLLAGRFPELEDELAGLARGGSYHGAGRSPGPADAMVWALAELMLRRRAAGRGWWRFSGGAAIGAA